MEKSPIDVSTSWGLPNVMTYVERGIWEIIPWNLSAERRET
jgi:hypothetical protein